MSKNFSFFKSHLFSLVVSVILLSAGCSTQRRAASTLGSRLTDTQNYWRTGAVYGTQSVASCVSQWKIPNQNVQQVLDRLVYVSPLRGYPVRAYVVPSNTINAKTDGLNIMVHSGFVELFGGQQDIMASVLAHELGHILAGHRPSSGNTSSLALLQYASPMLSFVPYGSLAGTALNESAKMKQAGYSRIQENEADAIGAVLSSEAGYDAHGLSWFLDQAAYGSCSGAGFASGLSVPTSLSGIPQSVAVPLLRASPLYRSHPSVASRQRIIDLISRRKNGQLSADELREEEPWLEDIYETMERRRPKNQ